MAESDITHLFSFLLFMTTIPHCDKAYKQQTDCFKLYNVHGLTSEREDKSLDAEGFYITGESCITFIWRLYT